MTPINQSLNLSTMQNFDFVDKHGTGGLCFDFVTNRISLDCLIDYNVVQIDKMVVYMVIGIIIIYILYPLIDLISIRLIKANISEYIIDTLLTILLGTIMYLDGTLGKMGVLMIILVSALCQILIKLIVNKLEERE